MGTRLDNNGLATVLDKIKSWAESKFITDAGVTSFNGQTGAVNVSIPAASTTTPNMDGTGAAGSSTNYARADHVHPKDTSKVDKVTGKGLSTNDFTNDYKTKLDGIEEGAEVNVQADWNETQINNAAYIKNKPNIISAITLFTAYCDTASGTAAKVATLDDDTGFPWTTLTGVRVAVRFKYSHTSISAPTLSIKGTANYQTTAANIVVPKDGTAYNNAGGDHGWGAYETLILTYNGSKWVKSPSSLESYTAISQLSNKAPIDSPLFTGTPLAPTATAGTNTTQIATTAFVTKAVSDAITGVASFKGTVNSSTDISGLATYTAGQYWVVATAGTYVNQSCEAGDMIYCINDYGSAYSTSDFSVVQNNTEALSTTEINQIWNTVFNAS